MPFDPIYGNSSDEELLALGQKAGYLPEAAPGPADIDMEGEPGSEASAGPAPFDDRQDYHNWVPAQLGHGEQTRQDFHDWVPGQLGFNTNPANPQTTTPSEVPPQAPTPGPQSTSTSQSVSASGHAYNEGRYQAVSKNDAELNNDLNSAENEAQQRENRMVEPQVAAAEANINAAKGIANANVDIIAEKGRQALVMQRLQDEFAAEETKANAEAQALANKSKADYLAALSDFRASRVDPAQLWGKMNGGEKFGMLATAFVHDFLGAKGIHTSAMDTFNHAIDRNIDAQIAAIKTKGEVAEGFKSLWYMQRHQSADDVEARARVKGFLLESAKNAVIANMSKYESALATAQGKQAVAKIDEELAKNLVEIYKHADANAIALRNQAIEKWKTKLQMAQESWANSIAAKNAQANMMRANKETAPTMPEPIYNPETGKVQWMFHPWIQEAERKDTRTLMENMTNITGAFNDLRKMAAEMNSTADPIARTKLADTMHQNFDALATRIAHGMAKANSERATDQDVVDFLKGMREKTWFNRADVEKVIAFTQKELLEPAYSKVKVMGRDAMPEEVKMYPMAASSRPFNGDYTDASFTATPPQLSSADIAHDAALEMIESRGANEQYEGKNSQVQKFHKQAIKFDPSVFTPEVNATVPIPGSGNATLPGTAVERPVRNFEKGLTELYNQAKDTKNPALAKTSREQLQNYASPYLNNLNKDDHSAFAAMLLYELNSGE